MGLKVEVDIDDLEFAIKYADDYVSWKTHSWAARNRLMEAIRMAKEDGNEPES